jgi:outer membrane protein OmpA-like peptidoglycan-associated protein
VGDGALALGLGLLVGLLFWRSKRRRRAGWLSLLLIVAAVPRAAGQAIDAERFQPTTSATGFFGQEGTGVLAHGEVSAALLFGFARNVLVVRDPITDQPLARGDLLSRRWSAHFIAGVGLFDRLELGVDLPLVLAQGGDTALVPAVGELGGGKLGDLRLSAKVLLLRARAFELSAAAALTLPTGDEMNFAGGKTATFTPRAVLGFEVGRVRAAINGGYRLRGQSMIGALVVGDEVLLGAGASVAVVRRHFWLIGEGYLAAGVQGPSTNEDKAAELLGGVRWAAIGPWTLSLAGGVGLTHGYGAPGVRAIASFGYLPQPPEPFQPVAVLAEPPPPLPPAPGTIDSDGDGYPDVIDQCPFEPEDFDHFQDEDGCPDPDNDGDGIPDVVDQCPNEPETINGVEDADGCPDEGLFVMVENRIVLEDRVLFDVARARVKHAARPVLQAIVNLWRQHPEWGKMVIEGHADVRGSVKFNQWISDKRAHRVREYLIGLGMPAEQVTAIGYGKSRPRDTSTTEEGHQRNRRVEFVVVERGEKPAGIAKPSPQPAPSTPKAGEDIVPDNHKNP